MTAEAEPAPVPFPTQSPLSPSPALTVSGDRPTRTETAPEVAGTRGTQGDSPGRPACARSWMQARVTVPGCLSWAGSAGIASSHVALGSSPGASSKLCK